LKDFSLEKKSTDDTSFRIAPAKNSQAKKIPTKKFPNEQFSNKQFFNKQFSNKAMKNVSLKEFSSEKCYEEESSGVPAKNFLSHIKNLSKN
jgi:hypothetical protein